MKHLHSNLMTLLVVTGTAATLLFTTGCTGGNPAKTETPAITETGAVAVDITLGKIGLLAKTTTIEMKKCIIDIVVKETDSVFLTDTSELEGFGETSVKRTFLELTAPEDYILAVTTLDENDKEIHRGSKEFSTIPADTVDVAIDLDAKYSMLNVSFNNLPDSVTAVQLGITEVDTLDTAFVAGEEDTVTLSYDYLAADTEGVEYELSLRASGSFYGNDTVLYAADTTVIARTGVDSNYTVTLKWVGPDIPHGAAEITVTIGAVGVTQVDAGFGNMPLANHGIPFTLDNFSDNNSLNNLKYNWYYYDDIIGVGPNERAQIAPNSTPSIINAPYTERERHAFGNSIDTWMIKVYDFDVKSISDNNCASMAFTLGDMWTADYCSAGSKCAQPFVGMGTLLAPVADISQYGFSNLTVTPLDLTGVTQISFSIKSRVHVLDSVWFKVQTSDIDIYSEKPGSEMAGDEWGYYGYKLRVNPGSWQEITIRIDELKLPGPWAHNFEFDITKCTHLNWEIKGEELANLTDTLDIDNVIFE